MHCPGAMNRSNQLYILVAFTFAASGLWPGAVAANDESSSVDTGGIDPGHCVSPELQLLYGPSVDIVARSQALPPALLWALLTDAAAPELDPHELTLRTAHSFQHSAAHAADGLRATLDRWVSGSGYRPLRPDELRRVQQVLTAYSELLDCKPSEQDESKARGPTDLQRLRAALDRVGAFGEGDDVDGVFDRQALKDALSLLHDIPDGSEERAYADGLETKLEVQLRRLQRPRRSVPAKRDPSHIAQPPHAAATRTTSRLVPVASPPTRPPAHESCTPGYDPCIPLGPDVDCAGGRGNGPRYVGGPVRVFGSDPYGLDRDGDGYGCE
jgi:hypothetical protein